jgi:integrase/recombinase XerD
MIRQFTDYTTDAETATYQDVLTYIAHLRKKNQHPKTIRNNLFAIKIYYRWLIGEGKRSDHPCQDLYLQDQINRSIDVENLYTKKQLEEFLETVKTKKQHMFLRDKTMVSLLVYQALTVLEISQLNVDDVNLDEGTIFIKGNIKNKSRTLNLQSSQIMLLHKYMQEGRTNLLKRKNKTLSETALILSENGTRIQQHAISRQINYHRETHEKMTPMKIRQSVIAHLLKSGNDLRVVQVFAGHRRAASTEEYKQTGLEELKNAINKHHPLQ